MQPFSKALVLTGALAITLSAQTMTLVHEGKSGSPRVRTDWNVLGAKVSLRYSRPFLKGRSETEVMPPGQPWQTGADEPTTLTTDRPLRFGSLMVPAGTYTLYTVPGAERWQLVISKSTEQWPYPEDQDLGRALMLVAKLSEPIEQLTIEIDPSYDRYNMEDGGNLIIRWGRTLASARFTVAF